jgi:hypothetical protein
MSIADECAHELETRCRAITNNDDDDGSYIEPSETEEVMRKLLYGYVDDPDEIEQLIVFARNAAVNTVYSIAMSGGPAGAMRSMAIAHMQDMVMGIIVGKRLAND